MSHSGVGQGSLWGRGIGDIWELTLLSAQFCFEQKLLLKKKSIFLKKFFAPRMHGIASVFLTKPDGPTDWLIQVYWEFQKEQFEEHNEGGNQIVNINTKHKSLVKSIQPELLLQSRQMYKIACFVLFQCVTVLIFLPLLRGLCQAA